MATISPSSGAVSAKLVPDPNSPDVHLGPGEQYVAPQLSRENLPPVYPSQLVPLHLNPHTVVVRVTFNERGRVSEIAASPVGASTRDDYQPLFEAAVRDAVQQWRCWPPLIRKFRPGPDADGDGKPDFLILAAERILQTFFDVSFSFEVLNGQPVVRTVDQ